jgi:hypothetical protein
MVTIPGGNTWAQQGSYALPVYHLSIDLAAGQQVYDIDLVQRSDPLVIGNLDLPATDSLQFGFASPPPAAAGGALPTGWVPDMENVFDWWVEQNPDDTSTLNIRLFPFYYHGGSGDALYHKYYEFDVKTLRTSVALESLTAPQHNTPGRPVQLALEISNSGTVQDVVIQTSIRTGSIEGSLPLRTLHDLAGTATAELTWDTRGYAANDYLVVVELLDTQGRLLDARSTEVQLGSLDATLSRLDASQEAFAPGDQIDFRVGVLNTGTFAITGTVVLAIQESEGLTCTTVLTAPVRGLAPGASTGMSIPWDTTGFEADRYRIVGYLQFHGTTSDPLSLTVYRPRIYLPLVVR